MANVLLLSISFILLYIYNDLEEAISLDSSQPEIYLMRGEIYLAQKKKELAKRDFEKAISLGVPQSDLRNFLQQTGK